jgi:hypothetical protein
MPSDAEQARECYLAIVRAKTEIYNARKKAEAITHAEFRNPLLATLQQIYDDCDRVVTQLTRKVSLV